MNFFCQIEPESKRDQDLQREVEPEKEKDQDLQGELEAEIGNKYDMEDDVSFKKKIIKCKSRY